MCQFAIVYVAFVNRNNDFLLHLRCFDALKLTLNNLFLYISNHCVDTATIYISTSSHLTSRMLLVKHDILALCFTEQSRGDDVII